MKALICEKMNNSVNSMALADYLCLFAGETVGLIAYVAIMIIIHAISPEFPTILHYIVLGICLIVFGCLGILTSGLKKNSST